MSGGEGGIRTPDTRKGMPDFESGAFNRALPPLRIYLRILVVGDLSQLSASLVVSARQLQRPRGLAWQAPDLGLNSAESRQLSQRAPA